MGMLVVETIAKIRRAYFAQTKPIKTICRDLRVSRKARRPVRAQSNLRLVAFCSKKAGSQRVLDPARANPLLPITATKFCTASGDANCSALRANARFGGRILCTKLGR